MNRERRLMGANSYTRELGFNPVDFLRARLAAGASSASWLDLCCGSGRALVEAAERLAISGHSDRISLLGVDLVPRFVEAPPSANLRIHAASFVEWRPDDPASFDLITCVHGIHYLGDKLEAVRRAVSWLAPGGRFIAHLDPKQLRWENDEEAGGAVLRLLRGAGMKFEARRHLLSCEGTRELRLPFRYVGADDQGGPNYTGQPAVTSYYERDSL